MTIKRFSRKGIVLVLTMVLMVSLIIFGVVFMATIVYTNNNAKVQMDSAKALYIAEAGIHKAIYYLITDGAPPGGSNDGVWRTTAYAAASGNTVPAACSTAGSPTTAPCQESLGCGAYTMWVETNSSNIKITSKGTCNGIARIVRQQIRLNGGATAAYFVENTWTEV